MCIYMGLIASKIKVFVKNIKHISFLIFVFWLWDEIWQENRQRQQDDGFKAHKLHELLLVKDLTIFFSVQVAGELKDWKQ